MDRNEGSSSDWEIEKRKTDDWRLVSILTVLYIKYILYVKLTLIFLTVCITLCTRIIA